MITNNSPSFNGTIYEYCLNYPIYQQKTTPEEDKETLKNQLAALEKTKKISVSKKCEDCVGVEYKNSNNEKVIAATSGDKVIIRTYYKQGGTIATEHFIDKRTLNGDVEAFNKLSDFIKTYVSEYKSFVDKILNKL